MGEGRYQVLDGPRLASGEKPGKRRFGQMFPGSGTEASAQECIDKYSQESKSIRFGIRDADDRREH